MRGEVVAGAVAQDVGAVGVDAEAQGGLGGELLRLGAFLVVDVREGERLLDDRVVAVLDADRRLEGRDAVLAGLHGAAVAQRGAGDPGGAELGVDVGPRGGVVGVHERAAGLLGGGEQGVVAVADLDAGAVARAGLLAAVVEAADAGDVAVEDDASAGVDAAVGVDLAGEGHRRAGVDLEVSLVERGVVAERGPVHFEHLAQDAGDPRFGVPRAGDDLDLLAAGRRRAGVGESAERLDAEPQLEVRVRRFGRDDAVAADVEALDAAVREQGPDGHHAVAEPGLGRDERPLHDERPPREHGGSDREPREHSGREADREERASGGPSPGRRPRAARGRRAVCGGRGGGPAARRAAVRLYSNETGAGRRDPGGPSTIT